MSEDQPPAEREACSAADDYIAAAIRAEREADELDRRMIAALFGPPEAPESEGGDDGGDGSADPLPEA